MQEWTLSLTDDCSCTLQANNHKCVVSSESKLIKISMSTQQIIICLQLNRRLSAETSMGIYSWN